MASMQYYRSCSETYETQHHENSSLTHKVSDMVGKVFHGNSHKHNHNNQSLCHGQTTLQPHHHHHNHQLGLYGAGYLTPTLGTGGYDHHGNHGYNNACSTECGSGTYEIRKVKNQSHSHRHKHRDGNRSCSDDSSGSDSD